MKNLFKKHPQLLVFWAVLALVFISVLAFVGYLYFDKWQNKDLVLKVGSEKITKTDLNEKYYGISLDGDINDTQLAEKLKIDEEQRNYFLDNLVEESLVRQYAEENNISVTDEEVTSLAEKEVTNWNIITEEQKSYAFKQQKANLLKQKVSDKVVSWKKGRYIEIRFDKHFVVADSLTAEQKAVKTATQEADIKFDREYADKIKDEIYKGLTDGTMTFDQAKEKVINDKVLDYKDSDFTLDVPYVEFDTLNSPEDENLLERPDFKDILSVAKKGVIQKPFVRKLDYGDWNNGKVDFKDSLWTILVVDEEKEGDSTSFRSWTNTQKMIKGVRSFLSGYESTPKSNNVAYAWNQTACTSGRYNEGTSHPGDLISEIRIFTAAGANLPIAGSYSYAKLGPGAYAYTGCPLLGGYTVGNYTGYSRSEASVSTGCMYKFSSVYSSTVNLCCSGNHNPHKWKLGRANPEPRGHFYVRYYGISTGSAWSGPYSGEYAAGYGEQYSDPTGDGLDFTIVNGKTIYLRGYWKVDPATTLTAAFKTEPSTAVSAKTAGAVITGTGINCGTDCSQSFSDNSTQQLNATYKITNTSGTYKLDHWNAYMDGSTSPTSYGGAVSGNINYLKFNMVHTWKGEAVYIFTPAPPITETPKCVIDLSVVDTSIEIGDSTLIGWENENVSIYTAVINIPGYNTTNLLTTPIIRLPDSGPGLAVSPAINTTYTISGRNSAGVSCTDSVTVTVVPPPVALECEAAPTSGPEPLIVHVWITNTSTQFVSPFIFNWGDGTSSSYVVAPTYNAPAWHTYESNSSTSYTINLNDNSSPKKTTTCPSSGIIVSPPTGGSGGEVAP